MNADQESKFRALIDELMGIPDEDREQEIVLEINSLSPDPNWSDYIYQSDEYMKEGDVLDLDRIVAKIKEHKVIRL
ncbi:hypothetical protein QEH59_14555 [Coraliomargarita sp. SDUM461004]|uniref:Colicin immunity protein n=1 Tax=Thalassobacterium sedimentorum TaxID=3041258 RepID=A0ABU1ALR5_9BACT|nr:hypothetical protein [Coraliomargarita sp. SDUM461004]MDQ8195652.1 hypothetical protein [Coraliomargarita sp. SDUM461004]